MNIRVNQPSHLFNSEVFDLKKLRLFKITVYPDSGSRFCAASNYEDLYRFCAALSVEGYAITSVVELLPTSKQTPRLAVKNQPVFRNAVREMMASGTKLDDLHNEPLCDVRWVGEDDINFLVESGAYPALTALSSHDPKKYAEFLAETTNRVDWDHIGEVCCENGNEIIASVIGTVMEEMGINDENEEEQ